MAFLRECQIHLVLHLCGLSEHSQQSAKPKPQKADLALLTSLRESFKKRKKQQYLCLAFFKKEKQKTKNNSSSKMTYKCKTYKRSIF